jgi:hypothetical protein
MKNKIFVVITSVLLGLFSFTAIIAQETVITVTDCTHFRGAGTISDAIARANIGGGTINFACGEGAIITFTDELTITNTVTIDGGGAITFDGNNRNRFFTVNEGASLTLNNITLQNGYKFVGGAINNYGDFTITDSTLSGNSAVSGGAIYNDGTLMISDSTLLGNFANFGSNIDLTGKYNINSGGAIFNSGELTITNSTLSGNSGEFGGAINNSGTMNIVNSTLSDSTAKYGGAINNNGTLSIMDSTLSGNASTREGGAIYNNSRGDITISNSTFINNDAPEGSIIYNDGELSSMSNEYIGNTCKSDDVIGCVTIPVVVIASSPTPPSTIISSDTVLGCVLTSTDGAGDNTYCRLLMQNGAVVDFNGAIPADLIRLGVILGVDVYRLEGGATVNTFPDYARICLAGVGRFFYMDGRDAPRVSVEMPSEIVDNMTCAWIPAPGTVILTN